MSFLEKMKTSVLSFIGDKLKGMVQDAMGDEFPNDYIDDGEEYHIIPEEYKFTYSSVKGDFRLHRLANGFCASWKKFIVARDWDGNELYRIQGYGRSVAISPDKTKIVASSQSKSIAIFDAATGEMIGDPVYGDEYLSDLVWTKNNHIIASNSDHLFVMNGSGELQYSFGNAEGGDFDFIDGVCLSNDNDAHVVIAESNSKRLSRVNFMTKEVVKVVKQDFQMSEVFFNAEEDEYWIVKERGNKIHTFDSDLDHRTTMGYKGKEGVRFVGQAEYSYTAWTPLPVLSPDASKFLVNDQSGLLHLISAQSGNVCHRTFNRHLVDYAYAMIWQDDEHFVVLLDSYKVIKVNTRGMEPLFTQSDQ